MLRIDRNSRTFERLDEPTLSAADILERADLQEWIFNSHEAFFEEVGERLFLIGKELVPSETVQDRIDLLGVDPQGCMVIIELKRGSNKLQMLQAVSYAGMVARWDLEEVRSRVSDDEWDALVDFLEVDIEELNRRQRLLLVAESYDYALLSGAEWLSEQYGVDIRCTAVSLATDPATGAEYMACASTFPPPALAQQSVARGHSSRSATRPKWGSWDEALARIGNADVRAYAESELEAGRENLLTRRRFVYRVAGSRRWNLGCKNNWAYVWQRGRFVGDVGYWSARLDDPGSINPVKQGRSLSFKIYGREALEAFRAAVTGELQSVSWLGSREIEQEKEEGDSDDA